MDNFQQKPHAEVQESKELNLLHLKKLIQRARKASQKAKEAENEVFEFMETSKIDYNVESSFERCSTIEGLVRAYIRINVFNLSNIMKEIREWYLN